LEFVPVKVIQRVKIHKKFTKNLITDLIFPKPYYMEEGGDEILVPLTTRKDCSRKRITATRPGRARGCAALLCRRLQRKKQNNKIKKNTEVLFKAL